MPTQKIEFPGSQGALDDTQRAKLLEIADQFPVHRTLHSEVQVSTRRG